MPDLDASSFSIRANLGVPADQFDAEVASPDEWVDADDTDRISLQLGLMKADETEVLISHLVDGVIDEYTIRVTPDEIITTVQGRDGMAITLDRQVNKTYPRGAAQGGTADRVDADVSIKAIKPEIAPTGRWRASEIAGDVMAEVSMLQVSWQVRDYELRVDFNASGRPLDILRQLAEPWGQAESSPVDIFVEGSDVIVRNRTPQPIEASAYRFHIRDARIKDLTITKRPPKRLGRVILDGMLIQPKDDVGVAAFELSDPTLDIEERNIKDVTSSEVSVVRGPDGLILAQTSSSMKYRMPDGVMLGQTKTTLTQRGNGMELTQRETVVNTWETIEYDQGGRPLKQPNQLSGTTTIEGIHPADKSGTFQVLRTEGSGFAYDSDNFLTMTTTEKRELNLRSRALEKREMVIRHYRDVGPLLYELTTTTFQFNTKGNRWDILNHEVTPGAGLRPGGPGRSKTFFIPKDVLNPRNPGAPGTGMLVPIQLDETISTDPRAVDFTYSNENLTLEDLQYIMAQLRAGSDLWEVELTFNAITMPWLKKGSAVFFYGLEKPDATAIELKPAVVLEVNTRYDESSEEPSMISNVRSVYWFAVPVMV